MVPWWVKQIKLQKLTEQPASVAIASVPVPRDAITPPLFRAIGMIGAYLETGDPYLLQTAQTVTDAFFAIDRKNWPRRSYGRDGVSIRSLMTGQEVEIELPDGTRQHARRTGEGVEF